MYAKVAISVRADKPIIVCPTYALSLQNNIVLTIIFRKITLPQIRKTPGVTVGQFSFSRP